MRVREIEVSKGFYWNVKNKVMGIVKRVSKFYKMDIAEVTHKEIQKFCQDKLEFVYCGYRFPDSMSGFGGMTIKNRVGLIVGYNSALIAERCNFSVMHETYHALNHMEIIKKLQQHSNITRNSTYTHEETLREIEADFGSSLFLLNDIALISQILEGKTYSQISKKYGISKHALKLRIINFLYFDCSISYNSANLYAERFINGYNLPVLKCVERYNKFN